MGSHSVAADAAATPVIVAEPTLAPATPPVTAAAAPSVSASPPAQPCAAGADAPPVLDVGAVAVTNAARDGHAYAPALLVVDLAVTGATTACGDLPWRLRLTAFSLTNGEASYPPTLIESGGTASSGEVSILTITDVVSLPIVATGQGDGVIHLTLSITLPIGAPSGDYRGSIGLSLEPDP